MSSRTPKQMVAFRLSDATRDNLQELVDLARAKERRPGGQLWMVDKINRTEVLELAIGEALTKARAENEAYVREQDERAKLVNKLGDDDQDGIKIDLTKTPKKKTPPKPKPADLNKRKPKA